MWFSKPMSLNSIVAVFVPTSCRDYIVQKLSRHSTMFYGYHFYFITIHATNNRIIVIF